MIALTDLIVRRLRMSLPNWEAIATVIRRLDQYNLGSLPLNTSRFLLREAEDCKLRNEREAKGIRS